MLKIKDSTGNVVGVLKDEDNALMMHKLDCQNKDSKAKSCACRKRDTEGEEDADTETTIVR